MFKVVKAQMTAIDGGGTISFLYNPTEVEETKSVIYEEPEEQGAEGPPMKFKHGGSRDIKINARFVAQGNAGDIESQLDFIRNLTVPINRTKGPTNVMLTLGVVNEVVKVKSYRILHKRFTTSLKPSDVTVEITCSKVYPSKASGPKQPTPASSNTAKGNSKALKSGE